LVARGLQHLQSNNLLIIDGGPAPENFSSKIKKFNPDLVIFIDAAHMDEPPGTIQWISLESIDGMSASTHSLPLSMLANFLVAELGCDVTVLGIQPAKNEIGSDLSVSVQTAVEGILAELKKVFTPS
jgi:hydrogenase 3 maturation protease